MSDNDPQLIQIARLTSIEDERLVLSPELEGDAVKVEWRLRVFFGKALAENFDQAAVMGSSDDPMPGMAQYVHDVACNGTPLSSFPW